MTENHSVRRACAADRQAQAHRLAVDAQGRRIGKAKVFRYDSDGLRVSSAADADSDG